MSILSLQELQTMHLPVDLSGFDPTTLNSMLHQATAWVNGEARHTNGFEAHRVIDQLYGNGTNTLRTSFYPVCTLNSIWLVFPPNQGNVNQLGPNMVPIDPSRVVVDHDAGIIRNWSPFAFQVMGYMTVFPDNVPVKVDYYTGYVSTLTTSSVGAGVSAIPVQNASTFYWGQSIQFYESGATEFLTVTGVTTNAGTQFVLTNEATLYTHQEGVSIGDMPPEVRLATAYVVCDFALRELNPEDLLTIRLDKFQKDYQRSVPTRANPSAQEQSVSMDLERPFIREARRLLAKFVTHRGII